MAALVILGETYRGRRSRANVHGKMDQEIDELRKRLDEFTNSAPSEEHISFANGARTPFDQRMLDYDYESLKRSVAHLWLLAEKHGWTPTPEEWAKELRQTLAAGPDNDDGSKAPESATSQDSTK